MQISWHGGHTIKITTKDTTVVLDPYSGEVGPSPFRAKADVVVLSCPKDDTINHVSGISGDPLVIDTPGEYSIRGMTLHGLGVHDEDGTERAVYRWHIEGVSMLYVGALNRLLTEKELGEITKTDIHVLLVPVGGGSGLTTKQAHDMVSVVEPRIVIPTNFKIPKWKEKLEGVESFAKEMGVSASKSEKKVLIKANRLPVEDIETVILKP